MLGTTWKEAITQGCMVNFVSICTHLQDDDYPYVYLLTAPKVLGHVFNPVSFWYLYSVSRTLAAVILEVNNNFGERHMYLLKASGMSGGASGADPVDPPCPRTSNHFTSIWPKDFHVSPFNPREGMSYALTTADPLLAGPEGTQPIDSRIVLVASDRRVQLIATIRATGPAIRPAALSTSQRYQLIFSWGWVGALTEPRIFFQAARLHLQRKLRVWSLPVPLERTISRHASQIERSLEPFFRGYLRYLVENASPSLTVRYYAAGLCLNDTIEVMQSPLARRIPNESVDNSVELRVLRPDFYTSFAESHAFTAEAVFALLAGSGLLRVSGMDRLRDLVCGTQLSLSETLQLSVSADLGFRVIDSIRKGRAASHAGLSLSALDCYVLTCCTPAEQRGYRRHLLQLLLSRYLAFGSVGLLQAQVWVAHLVVVWVLLRCLGIARLFQ
ncbi:hypothetical protein BO94DRAFT_475329 [Aspergillus sclerotioniger CBS 115572]|uniref:DUF1365-domain-containing protein n=1 Tax=Aspergillus sclerotioniger CBS 115572 TaxID=1450535 RepID=A0A317VMI3_9EURO|nr:hypothetical protein BO94DRAFT_475329 [Aspergillus sclerotioniger CBS 115572]PWY73130.1 hypothetical protein BO94DRAFT_475329 [Aspergillus sclerotioniger CBS 115572]